MPFTVPEGHEGLSRQVFQRFRSLVTNGVIDVVTTTGFDAWRQNFRTDEEQYFAAQLLSAAVIRIPKMNQSSYRQIAEVIVPALLRESDLWNFRYVDEWEQALRSRRPGVSIRFMPVDGQLLDAGPGNSADSVVRDFRLAARVGDGYLVRADDQRIWEDPPQLLIFLDDLLGTGDQFRRFATRYRVDELPATTRCAYVPLMASVHGMQAVSAAFPRVTLRPVETLHTGASFFSELAGSAGIWARDRHNSVADARAFYRAMMNARGVGPEAPHCLDLTVLLPDRPPNNTLKAYWSDHGQWIPLQQR